MPNSFDDGEIALTVGGQTIQGWTRMRVTRGIERCPNDFDLELTEVYPLASQAPVINPGDAMVVAIGGETVITGYVDDYVASYGPQDHKLRVTGRGKCADLVDCSAEWPTGQISGTNALDVATKLAQPYGLTVSSTAPAGAAIPQFNLSLGETAYQIIERICRYAALLPYEDTSGNLVLAQVGTDKAASGAVEGQNVQRATYTRSMRERFSLYQAFLMSVEVFGDTGNYAGNLIGSAADPNVPRHRLKYLIAEAVSGGQDLALKRALWEAARRQGRGQRIEVTVDSWRDAGGQLWTPNTLVPLDLPGLKLPRTSWVLGEVSYLRDEQGTRADLSLAPATAFDPEPLQLQPVIAGLK